MAFIKLRIWWFIEGLLDNSITLLGVLLKPGRTLSLRKCACVSNKYDFTKRYLKKSVL